MIKKLALYNPVVVFNQFLLVLLCLSNDDYTL